MSTSSEGTWLSGCNLWLRKPLKKISSWKGTNLHLPCFLCSFIRTCCWPQLELDLWAHPVDLLLYSNYGLHYAARGWFQASVITSNTVIEELSAMLSSLRCWGATRWVHRALRSAATLSWVPRRPIPGPGTAPLGPDLLLHGKVTALGRAFKRPPRQEGHHILLPQAGWALRPQPGQWRGEAHPRSASSGLLL